MEESLSIMFTIQSWYVLGPVGIIGLIWFISWAKRQKGKVNLAQYILLISFGIYLLCVIHLVFFPIDVNIGRYANQTPWYMTVNFIPILTIDLTTFLLNILMLIPFGMYIPFLKKTKASVKKAAKLGFMLSLSLELLQLLIRVTLGSGRSSDINDLLANTIGAVIGFLIVKTLFKISQLKNMLKQFQL
ncbi:teicoplanin resistance protein VanZ [Bacillus sp. SA1-12]|uniref:VanZ family protein n=1 Tax=Bacillus sp. SA1-12 TaxID=1455638 RepID=UPI0006271999|nr:VanZ family protein [Bacillus sp. SA1-12]KKI89799.1 teicoplanin resistance protein VanZ [Bacillus sp. SA1-12]